LQKTSTSRGGATFEFDRFTVEVRVFDAGVAFRYLVPGGAASRVPDEATTFRLPAGSTVWFHDFSGHYEGIHKKYAIAEVKAGEWAAPPVTFALPGGAGYGSITEAGLRDYAGMALQADGQGGFAARLGHAVPPGRPFTLRYTPADVERLARPAAFTGDITTPWRVVLAGRDLHALVNSGVISTVCPPLSGDFSWVKPGRAVWRYLDGGDATLAGVKEFSRLAGELGFEYQVIEGFWAKWTPEELRDAVEYSKQRGVRLFVWRHCREVRDPEARRALFARLRDAGVAGVKLDFFDHEAKEIIDLYQACLRDAAQYHLMVNFHGANKPTGESRTFPNELTREGVRGMEYRSMETRAQHNTTLPFTRFLAGPADYTPVHFGERRKETTWAHQIASAVIFTSGLLTYAAHPKALLDNPAVDVIKAIPAVWDETIVLPGSAIGEAAAYARRSGKDWFVAVMNGPQTRRFDLKLTFLGRAPYRATLVRDDPANPAAVKMETTTAPRAIRLDLAPGGGFIARFVRP
jgi:alpha-glucosidase